MASTLIATERLRNFVGGSWIDMSTTEALPLTNPATGESLGEVPLSGSEDVDRAVQAAKKAFEDWRKVPPVERARYLFRFKDLLDRDFEKISRIVTMEHGKTLPEARGSVKRGVECVEVACGIPSLMMGETLEDVARGIDCDAVPQPLGVFAAITPFNFPAMVPLWFLPFAVACGNTFIVKPSEKVPHSQNHIFHLLEEAGFPPGVVNLVHGAKEAVEGILDHPDIRGVSFVGSSPVAEMVYRRGAASGKRVQALGGAKNFIIVMPDADMETAIPGIIDSAYGNAGERCLAAAVVVPVGEAHQKVREGIKKMAEELTMGNGLEDGVTMGPLISSQHKEKVLGYIDKGIDEGAELVLDGRERQSVEGLEKGNFLGATLFDGVKPGMKIAEDEIFGPVLSIMPAETLSEAIDLANRHPLANASSIFTTSGKAAREFRYQIDANMAGVNIGVAAPMAFFSFGGAKGSIFGDLKAHGKDAISFYTTRKVVIERW